MRSKKSANPAAIAQAVRRALQQGGSAERARGVQWFFKEEVQSHGWYTADLRRLARWTSREVVAAGGLELLLGAADRMFSGPSLEEKNFAVLLLETSVKHCGEPEFRRFESWLSRVTSWSDHDALVHNLIGAMMVAQPTRVALVFRWARSGNRWRRRAAAVSLIRGARRHMFFWEIVRLSDMLLRDDDDMVQKGLGWLLRETAKADPRKTVPYLMRIRDRAPRLVLRTACETLPKQTRTRILAKPPSVVK